MMLIVESFFARRLYKETTVIDMWMGIGQKTSGKSRSRFCGPTFYAVHRRLSIALGQLRQYIRIVCISG